MAIRREIAGKADGNQAGSQGSDTIEALILDLLEWINIAPRPHAEVLDAWRTSCPRLPVWEEATRRGFVVRHHKPGLILVALSPAGADHLAAYRPSR